MRRFVFNASVLVLMIMSSLAAHGCEWIQGYFHQATQLKGRVVGRSLGPFQFQWLRRMFVVSNGELSLYDYQERFDPKDHAVAQTRTNSRGEFQFLPLRPGHYRLQVKASGFEDWFDVEITNGVPKTDWIMIDISPNFPDCTGGHQFEVHSKLSDPPRSESQMAPATNSRSPASLDRPLAFGYLPISVSNFPLMCA